MSRISVAMTTYNGAAYLLPQLQSLLRQTRLPDEVIICDDKSQDDSVQIVKDFIEENALKHWVVVENDKNLGYIENFRKAMSLTTGDIVFLCDQDDVWHHEKVATMVAAMESNTMIAAMACGYRCIDQTGNPLDVRAKKFYTVPAWSRGDSSISKVRYGRILYHNIAQGCATAYRRWLVDRYCAVNGCNHVPHDWALNMMAYEAGELYFIDEELLFYRLHGRNALGLGKRARTVAQRVSRIESYAEELSDMLLLPLSASVKQDIKRITELTYMRVRFLREKKFSVWLVGLVRYFPVIVQYFFVLYMKDLAFVLIEGILSADSHNA